jgi:starch synthase
MRIALFTNEYPPHVYGGAGVHVEYLSQALSRLEPGKNPVEVYCFGDQRETLPGLKVTGLTPDFTLPSQNSKHAKLMDTLAHDLLMAGTVRDAQIVHCHTWYTHFAGCLTQQLLRVPLVLTTHSLEPHRPWKVEQLGNAYHASTWLERTAYQNADGVIAVSESMKRDVQELYGVPEARIRVIPNGVSTREFRKSPNPELLRHHGLDPEKPIVLFVGRITRQKGILHLLHAIPHLPSGVQVVLCAGMPDTAEIGAEMESLVQNLQSLPESRVFWIPKMLPREELASFYSHATVFVCPSVYEPFGLINLEAMACGTPVVASRVGGIPEVVVEGVTGLLVEVDSGEGGDYEPKNPEAFSLRLAEAIRSLLQDPHRAKAMGAAGLRRVEEHFSWDRIAARTLNFYEELIASHAN